MKLPHHNRYDYIPLPKRKTYEWPGGKRIAFCINNNIENFAYRAGLGVDQASPGSQFGRGRCNPARGIVEVGR